MFSSSRRVFLAASAAFLSLTIAGSAVAQDASKKLRVATSNLYATTSTFPAAGHDKAGEFTFEIIPFASVTNMIAAINAGEIDVAEMGEVGPVVAQAADVKGKIIAATEPWRIGEALVVTQDSPIKTLADLKGKKVSYSRATNGQWVVNKALRDAKLTIDDIESVFLPAGTNIYAVLESGGIDVAVAIDAQLSAFEAQGARRLVNAGDVGVDNSLFFLASDTAIANKKPALHAFVKQLSTHLSWADANQKERAKAVASLLKIDETVAQAVEKSRPKKLQPIQPGLYASNQDVADTLYKQKVIEKQIKVDSSFTDEFNSSILSN